MASSLPDAKKAPRSTLDAVLLSEPISSLEISEVGHGVGLRHDVHGLLGGDARVCPLGGSSCRVKICPKVPVCGTPKRLFLRGPENTGTENQAKMN